MIVLADLGRISYAVQLLAVLNNIHHILHVLAELSNFVSDGQNCIHQFPAVVAVLVYGGQLVVILCIGLALL
jgi:hypothetical protein